MVVVDGGLFGILEEFGKREGISRVVVTAFGFTGCIRSSLWLFGAAAAVGRGVMEEAGQFLG
jgi:RsiW-degrading membrane proteinase PrsW (M82 family)